MKDWMDLKAIEELLVTLRKKEYDDVKNKPVEKSIQLALSKIKQLKKECHQNLREVELTITDSMLLLLTTEAQIINIIEVVIYSDFTNQRTLTYYLERESAFAYQDYIEDIQHYADDFQQIGILPKFYMENVVNPKK
ncbi:hypothetical protein [Enterococcus mundtii]|uniref:Uncharacterized protein n=1 Tax=Enterococcus mundtii TaxID=53346 RepID=A0A848MZU4_ENTMU|nr:hypothetical protein [Enterococcus mundtii]NMP59535.1 hypothetical protein [Enterococcus mundtii]